MKNLKAYGLDETSKGVHTLKSNCVEFWNVVSKISFNGDGCCVLCILALNRSSSIGVFILPSALRKLLSSMEIEANLDELSKNKVDILKSFFQLVVSMYLGYWNVSHMQCGRCLYHFSMS